MVHKSGYVLKHAVTSFFLHVIFRLRRRWSRNFNVSKFSFIFLRAFFTFFEKVILLLTLYILWEARQLLDKKYLLPFAFSVWITQKQSSQWHIELIHSQISTHWVFRIIFLCFFCNNKILMGNKKDRIIGWSLLFMYF